MEQNRAIMQRNEAENYTGLGEDKLRAAGLSRQKIIYIKDLAGKVASGEVNLALLNEITDDEIIRTLTDVFNIFFGSSRCSVKC